ncbi:MAG TPA: type II toxin-antitoxin system Phd/YefM family antitoxin [Acidimicrobiales bacterium]|nr:type II toxin-antitoxin system Phd/YefM family antitoxin [Acidimicrobiales bacterium]
MTRVVPQRELRNNNAKVIDAVIAGETFLVTRNGEQVAELRPLSSTRRTLLPRAEIAALASPGRSVDFQKFRDDIDHFIDQTL